MRILGPVFQVVISAIIGAIIAAAVVAGLWFLVEPRRASDAIWMLFVGATPTGLGAIVGAIAGSTSVIVRTLRPREPVSWD